MSYELHHGDCIEVMRAMDDNSIDAIVTDPPYGLGFMGKKWDELPPGEEWARECLRILKPGGHLLSFGGTRTWHRLAVAVEDAGFEIRDSIAWMYGSGFPKSLDVSKAIDKAAGAERTEVIGTRGLARWKEGAPGGAAMKDDGGIRQNFDKVNTLLAPATAAAEEWQGWGTALKPAFEPIVVARKPLTEKTVAQNVLTHRTGALNIDACRIGTTRGVLASHSKTASSVGIVGIGANRLASELDPNIGRWPANVALDEDMAQVLDGQSADRSGMSTQRHLSPKKSGEGWGIGGGSHQPTTEGYNDSGGASRFFYVAKAPKRERPVVDGVAHPTVKPLALMRWLCKLVTPEGGTILDPFAGSGTTIEAAILEGFNVIGIEREAEYLPLIEARIERAAE